MKYYSLRPEVAGGLGVNTVLDHTVHPPIVTRLHYEFQGWLGDELLTTFPCYIVTDRMRIKLETAGVGAAEFAPVEVTVSEEFLELFPDCELPQFVWLKVHGIAGRDDFGIGGDHRLVIAEKVRDLFELKHCTMTEFVGSR